MTGKSAVIMALVIVSSALGACRESGPEHGIVTEIISPPQAQEAPSRCWRDQWVLKVRSSTTQKNPITGEPVTVTNDWYQCVSSTDAARYHVMDQYPR